MGAGQPHTNAMKVVLGLKRGQSKIRVAQRPEFQAPPPLGLVVNRALSFTTSVSRERRSTWPGLSPGHGCQGMAG